MNSLAFILPPPQISCPRLPPVVVTNNEVQVFRYNRELILNQQAQACVNRVKVEGGSGSPGRSSLEVGQLGCSIVLFGGIRNRVRWWWLVTPAAIENYSRASHY